MSRMTGSRGVCAWCRYWTPRPPPGWKPPDYDLNAKPDLYDWRSYVEEKHGPDRVVAWRGLEGSCYVDPLNVETVGEDCCARYVNWRQDTPTEMVNDCIQGTWKDAKIRDIERQNDKLKQQLSHSKKLSASRLSRLRAPNDPS